MVYVQYSVQYTRCPINNEINVSSGSWTIFSAANRMSLTDQEAFSFSWKTTIFCLNGFSCFFFKMGQLCSEQFSFISILPTDKEALSLNFDDFHNFEEGIWSRIPRFNLPTCTKHNWGWGRLVTKRKTRKGNIKSLLLTCIKCWMRVIKPSFRIEKE